MHTYSSLKKDLLESGLLPSDTVLIHSSMKSIGNVDGGADTVLDVLMDYFGREDAKVLEYWLDNSLFSHWKKPPKPFSADPEKVKAEILDYAEAGFSLIATFGCYLGEDYEALYGEPDITPFTNAFQTE